MPRGAQRRRASSGCSMPAWAARRAGGLSVVTAALDRRVRVAAPDVPFLCNFPLAVEVAGSPYREIAEALKAHPERREEILRVLSYFDAMNHAPDVRSPIVFSASL